LAVILQKRLAPAAELEEWGVMFTVAALYRFAHFEDPAALRAPLLACCQQNGIMGTLLLANEGINGTVAGTADGIDQLIAHIRALPDCDSLEVKYAQSEKMPFLRMKVRLKKEIVTLGIPVDPRKHAGQYVAPADWNALISDPDTIIIDTRNDYEVGIGSFAGAINPGTTSFSEFPEWFSNFKGSLPEKAKVAMFCTGGIRCEKSTAYLKSVGVEDVFHLEGGILKYLETVPEEESLWQGECFVFDQRVSVGHGLSKGTYAECRACRMPLRSEELGSPLFIHGVQCPHCAETRSDAQRNRYAERQRQVDRAAKRGESHLGRTHRGEGN
jgi:UPF0176 protein